MKFKSFGAVIGVVGLLGACAQQEEPAMVAPEPIFNKYGEGACVDGYIYVVGATRVPQCIPEDECEPVYNSAGAVTECLPPRQTFGNDGSDDSSGNPGRTGNTSPFGAAAGP
jgi:hypothetical protein